MLFEKTYSFSHFDFRFYLKETASLPCQKNFQLFPFQSSAEVNEDAWPGPFEELWNMVQRCNPNSCKMDPIIPLESWEMIEKWEPTHEDKGTHPNTSSMLGLRSCRKAGFQGSPCPPLIFFDDEFTSRHGDRFRWRMVSSTTVFNSFHRLPLLAMPGRVRLYHLPGSSRTSQNQAGWRC